VAGSENVINYTWLPDESNDSVLNIYESGLYHIITENINGCIATDSIFVTIQGVAPIANFTAEYFCLGDASSFTDLSWHQDSIAARTWVFNDTDTLFSESPQYVFPNIGMQKVQLIVESFGNCISDTTIYFDILDIPELSFSYLPVCTGINSEFISDISAPQGDNIVAISWLLNGDFVSDSTVFINSFHEEGDYTLTLIAEAGNGCSDYYEDIINVASAYPLPGNFQLIAPIDNIYSSNINFQWTESENAIFYQVLVSGNPDFNDTLLIADSIFSQMKMEDHPIPAWIVMSPGTGGTSATIGRFIRFQKYTTQLCVVDPENSVFFDYFHTHDSSITLNKGSKS